MIKSIIISLLLIVSLHSENIKTEFKVRDACKELYKDYLYFKDKEKSNDGLKSRWEKLANEQKIKVLICNKGNYKSLKFYAPNPYEK